MPGIYYITVGMTDGESMLDHIEDMVSIEVVPAPVYPTGKLPRSGSSVIFARCRWSGS
jgi:hypothetical protein